jgi:hypothetical protein
VASRTRCYRPPRALTLTAALLAGALVLFGLAGPAGAQTPPPAPAPAPAGAGHAPPATNTFPIPAPYQVNFTDSWHACRDGCSRKHKGNDLLTQGGNPEVAVESGVIAKVQNEDRGLGGLTIWLRGDSGVAYYYAHNSANLVTVGQRVTKGQIIGKVGDTGNAKGGPTHIHFQINVCGKLTSDEPCTVDPYPFLTSWPQDMVDGGGDGVAWYSRATAGWGLRNDVGADLSPMKFGPAGAPDVLPVAGDWDGDGQDSVGLYRRSTATFMLRDDEGHDMAPIQFGTPGRTDVWPIAGDFDGDGRDTVGLYQQIDATFSILVDNGVRSAPLALGTAFRADALPVVGDWDGDGHDSVGVYQQADGTIMLVDDEGRPIDPAFVPKLGPRPAGESPLDAYPVAGDWDSDGRDTVGLMWRHAGKFALPTPDLADPGAARTVEAAPSMDALPVAGDWNGHDVVTLDELKQMFGPLPDEATIAAGLPNLNQAMLRAGITTPARKAAFLATLRAESGLRYDAVEGGSDRRYRGRGFIQLTGDFNYRAAGKYFDLDLLGQPELAANGLVSPAIAAWYWTVARDINLAADRLDMAAVNIAIGYRPSEARDTMRCDDFMTVLRYYSGGTVPDGVNCARTAASRRLALATAVPMIADGPTLTVPSQPGVVGIDKGAIASAPPAPPAAAAVPPTATGSTGPKPPRTTTTRPKPGRSTTTTTRSRPPTSPPTSRPTTSAPGTTSTTAPPASSTTTAAPTTTDGGTTSAPADSTTSPSASSSTSTASPSSVVPDSTTSTTLFQSQYP